jgi:hypothetical protein
LSREFPDWLGVDMINIHDLVNVAGDNGVPESANTINFTVVPVCAVRLVQVPFSDIRISGKIMAVKMVSE